MRKYSVDRIKMFLNKMIIVGKNLKKDVHNNNVCEKEFVDGNCNGLFNPLHTFPLLTLSRFQGLAKMNGSDNLSNSFVLIGDFSTSLCTSEF